MSPTVISVEHLSKAYRLGQIGTGTLAYDMKLWWAKVRGNPNPLLRIGETDHGNRDGETIWALAPWIWFNSFTASVSCWL